VAAPPPVAPPLYSTRTHADSVALVCFIFCTHAAMCQLDFQTNIWISISMDGLNTEKKTENYYVAQTASSHEKVKVKPLSEREDRITLTLPCVCCVCVCVCVWMQFRCDRAGQRWRRWVCGIEVGVPGQQYDGCSRRDGRLSAAAALRAWSTRLVPLPLVGQRQRTIADVAVPQTVGSHQRVIGVSNCLPTILPLSLAPAK